MFQGCGARVRPEFAVGSQLTVQNATYLTVEHKKHTYISILTTIVHEFLCPTSGSGLLRRAFGNFATGVLFILEHLQDGPDFGGWGDEGFLH